MNYWIGVVSLAHVQVGVEGSFCQFNHGKRAPVARMSSGDRFVYYSPRKALGGSESVQAFTAIGEVSAPGVYQVEHRGFRPFRRAVRYFESSPAHIRPLLAQLSFTKDRQASWGQIMRRGFFEVSEQDFGLIATAMAAKIPGTFQTAKG